MTTDILGRPLDPVPQTWTEERGGTIPEYYIYRALWRTGREEGIDFEYQASFAGGRLIRGGIIPDFLVYAPKVGINVQGQRYHLPPFANPSNDRIQRAQMESVGVRMEYISEEEALNSPDEAVRSALAGTRGRGPIEAFGV